MIVRPFNNYGPGQHLEKLVPRMITSALLGEPLTIHGDGRAARDWIHVEDTVAGLEAVLAAPMERVRGEVFNLGTGVATDVLSVARQVLELTGRGEELLSATPERPGQVALHRADVEKAARILGFEAERRLGEGLAATVDWYREHRAWWERLRWYQKVTIAMVNGWCFGGGYGPLFACDLAFCSDDAQFGLSEINWGILPGGGAAKVATDDLMKRLGGSGLLASLAASKAGPPKKDFGDGAKGGGSPRNPTSPPPAVQGGPVRPDSDLPF